MSPRVALENKAIQLQKEGLEENLKKLLRDKDKLSLNTIRIIEKYRQVMKKLNAKVKILSIEIRSHQSSHAQRRTKNEIEQDSRR